MATPTTTTPAGRRRGSFLETWRLFASGAGRVWFLVFAMFPALAIPVWFWPHTKAIAFAPCAMLIVFCFSFATWQLEGEMGERLAYLGIVPQPVDPRRLVWMPMCVLGSIVAIGLALFARLPLGAALALLATAWWTVAATRWLWKLRFWPLFVVPLLIVVPGAAHLIHRAGAGWGAAGAVAMVLAVGALAFQPGAYVGEPLSRRMEGGSRVSRRGPRGGVARAAISAAARDASWLAAAGGFARLNFGAVFPDLVILVALIASLGLLFPVFGPRIQMMIWLAVLLGRVAARAYSGEVREFLHARPFDRRGRFIGGVLPPLVVAVAAPLAALCVVNLDWIDHSGLLGLFFKWHGPQGDDLRYLREVLGATFLPDKWPADGLSRDLLLRLRPFLRVDALQTALVTIAMMLAVPIRNEHAGEGHGRRSVPWTNAVLFALSGAVIIRTGMFFSFKNAPLPGTWFYALLAAVSVAHFAWRARSIAAPAKREAARS